MSLKISPSTGVCRRCSRLARQLAEAKDELQNERAERKALEQKVKALQKQLDEQTRASQRQAAPFRRPENKKKPKGNRQKPGRKEGHARAAPPPPDRIDRTLDAALKSETCPRCQTVLDVQTHVQYQVDIPPVEPIVTQFNVQVGVCACCGERVQGTHPEQTSQALGAANYSIGPRALAFAADAKYRLGIPFRKVSDLLWQHFGLSFSAGGIARAAARLADRSRPVYELLKWQLSGKYVVHADETSWRIGDNGAWLHCYACDDLVIFTVRDTRGGDVVQEVLGSDFGGTVSCDGYAAYDVFNTARCNAHVIRRADNLADHREGTARRPLEEIRDLLRRGLSLRDRRGELTERGYRQQVTRLKRQIHEWIEAHEDDDDDEVGRLARHLLRYEQEFLLYLDDVRIPATNNEGERTLRFAVVLRKRGSCNKTDCGAATFEVLGSLLATFAKRGKDFYTWVQEVLTHGHPNVVPPDLLPDGCELIITF